MKKVTNTKEKICAFYASDYHFEMISLPYINKKIENNEEVIILTENNLEETIQTLLEKTNLQENKKQEILKINWKNDNKEKLKQLKNKIDQKENIAIFIKGEEKYIHKLNQDIEKIIPQEKQVKVIDCYAIEEVGENLDQVIEQYDKILGTTGEKEIQKL